jgi:hypothetical protein
VLVAAVKKKEDSRLSLGMQALRALAGCSSH